MITDIRDVSRNLKARSIPSQGMREERGEQQPYDNTHEIHVTADEIMTRKEGGVCYRAVNVDITVDINKSGAGGLDTGTKSPNTWYHIWILVDEGWNVCGVLSTSATDPVLPKGNWNYKAYVGAIYNNQNNCLNSYFQNDKLAWATKTYPIRLIQFPRTPTSVDLSASVPSTAISVIIELSGSTSTGGNYISNIYVGPTEKGPWHNQSMMVAGSAEDIDHVQLMNQCEIILDSAQEMYAYVGTSNDLLQINVLGWRY